MTRSPPKQKRHGPKMLALGAVQRTPRGHPGPVWKSKGEVTVEVLTVPPLWIHPEHVRPFIYCQQIYSGTGKIRAFIEKTSPEEVPSGFSFFIEMDSSWNKDEDCEDH